MFAAAARLIPAQAHETLEARVEKAKYTLSCRKKLGNAVIKIGGGSADFEYSSTDNNYRILVAASTEGIVSKIFFNREYSFRTEGNTRNGDFLPKSYRFTNLDRSRKSLTEVVQYFDFKKLKVNSIRSVVSGGRTRLVYNKNADIDLKTRDIMSALMELRGRPIPEKGRPYGFNMIQGGEKRRFASTYEGKEGITINGITYGTHKFRITDLEGSARKIGHDALIYLSTNPQKTPVKVCVFNRLLGEVVVEYLKP